MRKGSVFDLAIYAPGIRLTLVRDAWTSRCTTPLEIKDEKSRGFRAIENHSKLGGRPSPEATNSYNVSDATGNFKLGCWCYVPFSPPNSWVSQEAIQYESHRPLVVAQVRPPSTGIAANDACTPLARKPHLVDHFPKRQNKRSPLRVSDAICFSNLISGLSPNSSYGRCPNVPQRSPSYVCCPQCQRARFPSTYCKRCHRPMFGGGRELQKGRRTKLWAIR